MGGCEEFRADEINELHGNIQFDVAIRNLQMSWHDIRTAIAVLEAVESLGLVGTLIICVEHTIRVIVGIGTAIAVLEAIQVFGLRRALIVCVEHTILVIVWFWATVRILELVVIFKRVRATIIGRSETISICVRARVHLCVAHQHPAYRAVFGLFEHLGAKSQSSSHVLAGPDSIALALLKDGKSIRCVYLGIEFRRTDHGTKRACRVQMGTKGVDLRAKIWRFLSNRLSTGRTTNQ
jgi:hypothetical protein